jgi:hypothetical protein
VVLGDAPVIGDSLRVLGPVEPGTVGDDAA